MLKVNCITCKLEEIEDNYHCWCLAPKADRVLRHRFGQHECPVHKFKKECNKGDMECLNYSARFVNKYKIKAHKICSMCEQWGKMV